MEKNENLNRTPISNIGIGDFVEVWSMFGISIYWYLGTSKSGTFIGQAPGKAPRSLMQVTTDGQTYEFPSASDFINEIAMEYMKAYSKDPSHVGPWRDDYVYWAEGLNHGRGPTLGCPMCETLKDVTGKPSWFKFLLTLLVSGHSTNCPYHLWQERN